MTEKEKMMSGQLYDPNLSEELKKERAIVKDLCHEYNSLSPNEREKEHEVMKKILGKTKEHFRIHPSFWCDYGYNIEIGENFFSNYNLVILDCAKVTFGDNVAIGPNCGFYAVGHPIDPKERQKGLEYGLPITVGNNVWIGGGVNVMPGVTIGDNVVIGAGSVVTKDIESNSIAVGNPCRVIRKI